MTIPSFSKETNKKIQEARQKAYGYLFNIQLKTPQLGASTGQTQSLIDTLRQEIHNPVTDRPFISVIGEQSQTDSFEPVKPYDPEAEKRETAEYEERQKEAENHLRFHVILQALARLADENIPQLTHTDLAEIKSTLSEAPAFITQNFILKHSEHEVDAGNNREQPEQVCRQIRKHHYPGLKSVDDVEFTADDLHHTKLVLAYTHDAAKRISLALGDLLSAVNEVNTALNGRSRSIE